MLLNELAYSKYEASKSSSSTAETIILKQQKVTIVFSLVEKIIKLISNIGETEGMLTIPRFTILYYIAYWYSFPFATFETNMI